MGETWVVEFSDAVYACHRDHALDPNSEGKMTPLSFTWIWAASEVSLSLPVTVLTLIDESTFSFTIYESPVERKVVSEDQKLHEDCREHVIWDVVQISIYDWNVVKVAQFLQTHRAWELQYLSLACYACGCGKWTHRLLI